MRNKRPIGYSSTILHNYDRVFPIVVVVTFAILLNKIHSSSSLDFSVPLLTQIITLIFLTILFDAFVLHSVFKPEQSLTLGIGLILRSNLSKIFGGGLTQVFILSAPQGNTFQTFLKKWELLVVVNIIASTPFFLWIFFSVDSKYHSRAIVLVWSALISLTLARCILVKNKHAYYLLVLRSAILAFFSLLFASIALLFCTSENDLGLIPLISFVFIISLTIPIPNGFLIREFLLVYIFIDGFTLRQILFGSVLFRIIQLGSEIFLGIVSYFEFLYTKKKSLSEIDR